MREKYQTITPDKNVQVALDLMLKNGLDVIFIVEKDKPNSLLGIITFNEILGIGKKFTKNEVTS